MPAYRLSKLARRDLYAIADYTVDVWGGEQAERYLDGLAACFERLGAMPEMGRACDEIRAGYRRLEHEKHVIFYRVEAKGVLIIRILHLRMLPVRHLIEEE